MIYLQTFTVAISRPLGAISRVIFELKPFGIWISRAIGCWKPPGPQSAKMTGNSNDYDFLTNSFQCNHYLLMICNLLITMVKYGQAISVKINTTIFDINWTDKFLRPTNEFWKSRKGYQFKSKEERKYE